MCQLLCHLDTSSVLILKTSMKTNSISSILLTCIITLLTACTPQRTHVESSHENIMLKNISELTISEIVDSIHTIILDDRSEAIVGNIDKIRIVDSTIYIGDFTSNVITAFDLNGNYLFHIDNIGQGPGEYVAIKSFAADSKHLYVIDNWTGKLIKYDAINGTYQNESKMPFVAWDIEVIDSNKLLFTYVPMQGGSLLNKQPPYRLFITDMELNIKEKLLEFSFGEPDKIGQKLYFTQNDKNIVFGSLFFDGYTLLDKETTNIDHINIDFNNSLIGQDNVDVHDVNKYQFLTDPPFVCSHYTYLSMNDNGIIKECIYDSQTKNLLYNSRESARNYLLPVIGVTNNNFIAALSGIDRELVNHGFYLNNSTKIENTLNKEGMVLVFYKLK